MYLQAVRQVFLALLMCALFSGQALAQARWEASVNPSVELAVRNPNQDRFVADFALTSPSARSRHAHVSSGSDGFARVRFGDSATNSVWGSPEEDFSPSTLGRWTWMCTVGGHAVAHGAFVVSRQADGSGAISTRPVMF